MFSNAHDVYSLQKELAVHLLECVVTDRNLTFQFLDSLGLGIPVCGQSLDRLFEMLETRIAAVAVVGRLRRNFS